MKQLLLAAVFCAVTATGTLAQTASPGYGISVFGSLKYKPGFRNFDYVNPDAPKGGTIRIWGLDTFETLNPFILKGRKEENNFLLFDTLMTRAMDEPDALYGLVAQRAELSADRSRIAFTLNPKARFHDGGQITADDVVFTYQTLMRDGHPRYRVIYRDVAKAEIPDRMTVFRL